ncbi:restriction endonuclease subunit S [Muribaculaceae bacterium Isolate-105 (HZI)]|jgi:type I restriction enzyme S subunit|uniref:restriction endonuclease subunit S n=1 Tax=Muribaculaceae TaxID=2005473 RepID=UPI000F4AAB7D|nr:MULTISPECIES: restriction endonuclease subunit S [Muribaculaceae]ROT16288.1 restriction endonuclease subunit S [Muribaculaceae bacterium Isolate-105 (HZI)]ROT20142.1 restriction endonuclease subunit S [Muribaculaceae bacterium Isolate-114 (HZI)]
MKELFHLEYEWLPKFPTHWKMSRLKDHTFTTTGITFTKADLVETGNSVLSYGQVHAKNNPRTEINHELIRYIPDSLTADKSSAKVKKGDYIFADTSEDLEGCGNCIFVNEDIDLYAGYHTTLLRNESLSCGKYFAYLFMSDQWRSQIRKKVKSVKLFSISQGILNQTFIVIPPLAEQEAIAAYLDKECEKIRREIELLERKADCYRRLRRSLINRAVTRGLNPNAFLKTSEIPYISQIPSHWAILRIKDLFSERVELSETGDEDLLSVSEYYGVAKRADKVDCENISRSDSLVGYKKCYINDIVSNIMLAWKGSLGKTEYDGIVSPAYGVYQPIAELDASYFHYLFRTELFKAIFRTNSRGIIESRLRLYTPNFLALKTYVPPINEQHEIVAYLDEKCGKIDAIIAKVETKIERLRQLKRSLINEVVTGQRAI